MKVDMNLLSGTEEEVKPAAVPSAEEPVETEEDTGGIEEDEEDGDEIDESDKHSKLKTVLLVAAMVGGFALFVWNMTGFVNNMRMDSQGSATSIVQEMNLEDYMNSDGSAAVDASEAPEREVPTDADRDGPASGEESGGEDPATYANESEAMAALRAERDQAVKDKELKERELANAEKMLDAALAREAAGNSGE